MINYSNTNNITTVKAFSIGGVDYMDQPRPLYYVLCRLDYKILDYNKTNKRKDLIGMRNIKNVTFIPTTLKITHIMISFTLIAYIN